MFNLKPFVEPVTTVTTVVGATKFCLLVIFILDVLKGKDLGWEEVFYNCTTGFTIPSPLVKGEFENVAVLDLRFIGEDAIIFARCNSDWSELITHYRYDINSKEWIRLSLTYSRDNEDFYYYDKLLGLTIS